MRFWPPSVFAIAVGALLLSTLVAKRADAGDFDPGENRGARVTYETELWPAGIVLSFVLWLIGICALCNRESLPGKSDA
jgi:hypothetical protein